LTSNEHSEQVRCFDSDRYLASLLAEPSDQKKLHLLYCANLEIAKSAWTSPEPMISEIRLQWWKDNLIKSSEYKENSTHIVKDLVALFEANDIPLTLINEMVDARSWDLLSKPFKSQDDQIKYIDKTYGNLYWAGALLLGVDRNMESLVRKYAFGAGIASFFGAVKRLESLGKSPLIKSSNESIKSLGKLGMKSFDEGVKGLRSQKKILPVLLSAWTTKTLLKQVIKNPSVVKSGDLTVKNITKKWGFLWRSTLGLL